LELLLVRHGETAGNREKLFFGSTDYPLNENGRNQAKMAAEKIKPFPPTVIYTSPLLRAVQTARCIGEYLGLSVIVKDGLREMDFGLWEGLAYQQIQEKFPIKWQDWSRDWWGVKVPGGESTCEMCMRVGKAVEEIIQKHANEQVVIVSHHGCIRWIISHLLGFGKDGYWRFRIEPGGIARLQITEGFAVLCALNG